MNEFEMIVKLLEEQKNNYKDNIEEIKMNIKEIFDKLSSICIVLEGNKNEIHIINNKIKELEKRPDDNKKSFSTTLTIITSLIAILESILLFFLFIAKIIK